MSKYHLWSEKEYGAARNYFSRDKQIGESVYFEGYLYNALLRTIIHADPSHINGVLEGAKYASKISVLSGRYLFVVRVVKGMKLPFPFDMKEKLFKAHMKLGRQQKQRLSALQRDNSWKELFYKLLTNEAGKNRGNAAREWDFDKRADSFIRKAQKETGWDTQELIDNIVARAMATARKAVQKPQGFGPAVNLPRPNAGSVVQVSKTVN